MMLEEAGVARNTLYLHFEDHTALLEVALLEVFVGGVKDHLKLLTDSFRKSRTKPDFLKRVSEVISISQDRQRRDFRIARCRLIAHSDKNPRFSSLLKAEQSRINESYTAFFVELQRKGWMGNNVSPETAAVLVQALTLGRVIDDVSEERISQTAWNNAFMKITKEIILGQSSSG
jgi:AcrR family transcriptional regulator